MCRRANTTAVIQKKKKKKCYNHLNTREVDTQELALACARAQGSVSVVQTLTKRQPTNDKFYNAMRGGNTRAALVRVRNTWEY